MSTYEVWFKKEFDGRAPEAAFLDADFQWVGELQAQTPKEVQNIIATTKQEESKLEHHRPMRVGDVVRELGSGRAWVLTPVGIWATVQPFENLPG